MRSDGGGPGLTVDCVRWGYRGVIIGWDEKARAPESWLRQMHGEHEPEWRNQSVGDSPPDHQLTLSLYCRPNYAVLVDTRDRPAPQITYVPQENLETVKHTKILHPSVEDYFETFDGSQYLPRPWLRTIYRRD